MAPDLATSNQHSSGLWQRLYRQLPSHVDGRVRAAAWATLIVQVLIVGTGGLVRLTASGLGCPTWPTCNGESLVPTQEHGLHGAIEFGNRMVTFLLVVVAIVTILAVLRFRRERKDLYVLAILIALNVPAQAIIGGITVLTKLNPYVVGLHYFASAVLVGLSAAFLVRVKTVPGPRELATPPWFARLTHLTTVTVTLTLLVGILVTGAGPHAGDHGAARNGLPLEIFQHVHAWPGYITMSLLLVLLVTSRTRAPFLTTKFVTIVAVLLVQIVMGVWQARTGVPIVLANIHMVLAVIIIALMTAIIMNLKQPSQHHSNEGNPEVVTAL